MSSPLTAIDRVRHKTSRDPDLLPDSVIQAYIDEYTDGSVFNLHLAIADVFDYLASGDPAGRARKWSNGPVSMDLAVNYRDLALYYRELGMSGDGGIVIDIVTRGGDWPSYGLDPEYVSS